MPYIFKARQVNYDNIGGTATGLERTIRNSVAPQFTSKWGNNENIKIGSPYGADENLVVKGTNLLSAERKKLPDPVELAATDEEEFEDDDEADDDEADGETPKAKKAKRTKKR